MSKTEYFLIDVYKQNGKICFAKIVKKLNAAQFLSSESYDDRTEKEFTIERTAQGWTTGTKENNALFRHIINYPEQTMSLF